MKFIAFIFLCAFSRFSFGEMFYSSLHSLSEGEVHEPMLLRFQNGRASLLKKNKVGGIPLFAKDQFLKILIDENNHILKMEPISGTPNYKNDEIPIPEKEFEPTIVKNRTAAMKVFKGMRRDYTRSGECFNRAHIWAFESHNKSNLNLSKIFMFFTERYIRRYKFHWWFHVTPIIYVKNYKTPRTLDRRYTSGPLQTKTWSNVFVKSKRTCKIVDKFDDFFLNQNKEDCFHIYTSMYYYVPRDIEKRDLRGVEKESFVPKEVEKAYKNGFRKKQ